MIKKIFKIPVLKKVILKILKSIGYLEEKWMFEHEHVCNHGYACGIPPDEPECGSSECSSSKYNMCKPLVWCGELNMTGEFNIYKELR